MYDIRIWEEIRNRVEQKKGTLLEDIKREIASDGSLAEFQGTDPVPWQLRQVMEQRAESWTQRLYDFCCDARKTLGKEQSIEFDNAVWAYCIEPFMMKEVKEHGYRASQLLELLLCAVGSWPVRRSLLRVSQKDSCVAIRTRTYQTWYDKLHHLPSRLNEAAAAVARHNAIERQARRMVAGLPPEQPKVPPVLPTAAVTRVEEKTTATAQPNPPHQSKGPAIFERDEPAAPLSSAAGGKWEVIREEPAAPAATVVEGKWEEVAISFLSDDRVQIRRGGKIGETLNYADFGFADARTGNPNQAWETLRRLAERNGVIDNETEAGVRWPKLEKRIQEIRSVLRTHFGITSDPILFVEKNIRLGQKSGYHARFKISCARSYRT